MGGCIDSAARPPLAAARQRGYGLMELAVTLAVAGAVSVGAFVGVRQHLDTKIVADESGWMLKTIDELDRRFGTLDSYAMLGMKRLLGLENVPLGFLQTAPLQLSTGFGGRVHVASLNVGGVGSAKAFGWTVSGVPQRLCADFANAWRAGNPFALTVQPEEMPNSVENVPNFDWDSNKGAVTARTPVVVVKTSAEAEIDLNALVGTTACGTQKPTVALTFIKMKK